MKEKALKTSLLAAEIEMERQRRAEQAEITAAVPKLRRRLGNIIREHMSLPYMIEGKKVVLEGSQHAYPGDDWIRADPDKAAGLVHHKLSPTVLHCSATALEGTEVTFVLSSSGYPFEDQAGTDVDTREFRPVDFCITTEALGYSFALPSYYGGLRINFEEDGRTKNRATTIRDVNLLTEILDLIEHPTTKFSPQPYSIVQTN